MRRPVPPDGYGPHARFGVAVAIICIGLFDAWRAEAADKVALQLRWEPQFQAAGYFAALWQGYYAAAGLDVEIRTGLRPDRSQLDSIDEVLSGRAQFGKAGSDLAVAHGANRPVSIVADIFQQSSISVISLKGSNIVSPADLVGRKVRRIKGDMGDVEFQAMMRAEGLDPDAAVAVYAEADARGLELLRDGAIDAYIGYYYSELWRARLAGLAITNLRPSAYGVDFYGDTLFTSKAFRDAHPDVVRRFRDASLRGWEYALTHRAEIAERLARDFPRVFRNGNVEEFELFLAEQIAELTLYPMIPIGRINPSRWQNIHRTLKQAGLAGGDFRERDFIFDPEAEAAVRAHEALRYAVSIAIVIGILLVSAGIWTWTLKSQILARTRELAASEERYALAMNAADEGIWDWNILTGDEYLSPRWKSLLGFRDDELENRVETFFERLHPGDVRVAQDALEAHFERNVPYAVRIRLRHKDGTYRWFSGRGYAQRDASGRPIRMVGSNRDITARMEAEIVLNHSQAFIRSIADNLPVSITYVDKDLRYGFVNRTAERWFASSPADLIGKRLYETPRARRIGQPAGDTALMDAGSIHAALSGTPTRSEQHLIYPDGVARWIDLSRISIFDKNGEVEGYLRMALDITERKLAEQELRRSEAMLAEAQSSAKLGSWELDLTTNELFWSDEVFRIFEIDKSRFDASYDAFLAAIHPGDRETVDKAYSDSVANMTPYCIVHRLAMPDGRIKWVEERCRTWYGDDGCPIRSVGAIQDITERIEAEQKIRRSLAEKETLLREIHHRVKNNLQIISSLLYFQSQKISNVEDLWAITEGRNRLHSMMLVHEELFRSDDLSRVDFTKYMRSLVPQIAETYVPPDGRVVTHVEGTGIALPIELATPCGLIACELVTNAFKHAFPGGRRGAVTIEVGEAEGRVIITVRDDGVGLPANFRDPALRSFGSQLIERLVAQISGEIAVTCHHGTAATISFPYREATS